MEKIQRIPMTNVYNLRASKRFFKKGKNKDYKKKKGKDKDVKSCREMLSRPTFMPTPWRKNDCVFIFLLAVLNKFTIKTYSISLREKKNR